MNETVKDILKKAAENPAILFKPELLFKYFAGDNEMLSFD